MTIKLSNNAETKLSTAITANNTVIAVENGNVLPILSAGEWFPLTLEDNQGNMEIILVTARNGNALTVQRGKEGTQARSFPIGTSASLRLTAFVIQYIEGLADQALAISSSKIDPEEADTKYLAKTGGTITGGVTVNSVKSKTPVIVGVQGNNPAVYWTNGNMTGSAWEDWDNSGNAKIAISARIEARAAAIADQKIAAALEAFRDNPEFTGTLTVDGEIKTTGNISAFVPEEDL